jgi:hypothetical protein
MKALNSTRILPGAVLRLGPMTAVSGRPVAVPDAGVVHLQLRRFAGCPICNLHLRSFARRHGEIQAAGIREIAVFHSPASELRPHAADFPFDLIADPRKRLYRELGAEVGARALLDPRVWLPIVWAVLTATWRFVRAGRSPPALRQRHGRLGLPADFLIASDGRVLACKYGSHAYDQWSVDELLAIATSPANASDGSAAAPPAAGEKLPA